MVEASGAMAGERERGAVRPRVLLASKSPRRGLILEQMGVEHETVDSGVDDAALERGSVGPEAWAAAMAYLKAAAGAERKRSGVVLGADTVCIKGDAIVGQARDEAEATRILATIENAEHDVVTGVSLVWGRTRSTDHEDVVGGTHDVARPAHRAHRRIFVDRARVRVGAVGASRIGEYVAGGQWRGKEGAYNLSERIEAGWPIEFEGDAATIMGLPEHALRRALDTVAREVAEG